jgi:TfoX/Sxy family transcriptional regulator of competence genes
MQNDALINKVRKALAHLEEVEEKQMFRGITFMVNGKMCISVGAGELMCRINPDHHETYAIRNGCRGMVHGGKTMRGYIFVSEAGYKVKKDFDLWIKLCLDYNPKAKSSKKEETAE